MASEMYNPVQSLDISGRTLEDIQGEIVAPKTAPFRDGYVPNFSVVSLGEIKSLENGTETIDSKLVQITLDHGRSFELRFGKTYSIFWADEYGNVFSTLTTKGNNLANPHVARSSQEPSGFAVYGMQDTDALVRILRVSKLLRSHNVDTECYVKVIEPQELPYERKLVPLEEFKDNLIKQIDEQSALKSSRRKMNFGSEVSKTDIPIYSEHLDNSTFVITVRGMQIAERLQDVDKPESKEKFIQMMKRILRYVNFVENNRAKKIGREWTNLNPEKEEDLTKYFQEYLPARIAANYAGLHDLGLLHVYSHQGNISAVGSIYDLDSVKGEATGCNDEKVEKKEFKKELDKVFEETKNTISRLAKKGFFKAGGEPYKIFEDNFYLTYFYTRTDLLSQVKDIAEYTEYFCYTTDAEKLETFLGRLVGKLGWDYIHEETIEQLVATFYEEDEVKVKTHIENALKDPKQVGSVKDILERCLADSDNEGYSAIHGIDRFIAYWVPERIKQTISNVRSQELIKIENQYGKDTVEAIIELLGLREYRRFSSQITEEMSEDIEQKSKEYVDKLHTKYLEDPKGFYIQMFKDRPEDFDLLAQIKLVVYQFDYFDGDKENLRLYLEGVAREIGWDYRHREEYPQIAEQFLQELNFYTRAFFTKEWSKNPNPSMFNDIFDKAIHLTINCKKALDGIYMFTSERVQDAIRTLYNDELIELEKEYGEDKVSDLLLLISYREADAVLTHRVDDSLMDTETDLLFESIKTELAQQLAV